VEYPSHMSEDELRSKVVYQWLKSFGLAETDIKIEYTIKVQLGRTVRMIHSRTDVLVKGLRNENLLIVEVKKPNHIITEKDSLQALSYARTLVGGIAPFTILTNGSVTIILDSVSGEILNGDIVPPDHSFKKNGYRISGDAITARFEGLKFLLSLSKDNIHQFSNEQVQNRMSLLKSNDIDSGKKYIPQLYVDRAKLKQELDEKLWNREQPHQVVLAIAPPQQGKTSFLCNYAEKLVANNIACLFYPAIILKAGLLQAIKDDFGWAFEQELTQMHIALRLASISKHLEHGIVIIIDGWNEMVGDAFELNQELQRLDSLNIRFVISTTSSSLIRLLKDESDNPGFIAEQTNLSSTLIQRLNAEFIKRTDNYGLLQIEKPTAYEIQQMLYVYGKNFNVQFPEELTLPFEPYYIRLAAEEYVNNTVPAFTTRAGLITKSLIRKAARRGISEIELFRALHELAEIISNVDAPFSCILLPSSIATDISLLHWMECAILIRTYDTDIPLIDFYYTHDRDYSLAILKNQWHEQLLDGEEVDIGILNTSNKAIQSALLWFLSCPEYLKAIHNIFKSIPPDFKSYSQLLSTISAAILNQVKYNKYFDFTWIEPYIQNLISNEETDGQFLEEVSELIYSLILSLKKEVDPEKYQFWIRLLLKYDPTIEDLGVDESFIGKFYNEEAIRSWNGYSEGSTLDADFFYELIFDDDETVAEKAAFVYAYSCPAEFLESFHDISSELNRRHKNINSLYKACNRIEYDLRDYYYGFMCKGWLLHAQQGDDDVKAEYYSKEPILNQIVNCFVGTELAEKLQEILEDLKRHGEISDKPPPNPVDPNQLNFGF